MRAGGRRAASVRGRELRPRVLVGRDPPLERHGPRAVRARARDAARRAARADGLPPPLALLPRLPRLPAIPAARAPARPPLRGRARRRDARADRPPLHGRGAARASSWRPGCATSGSSPYGQDAELLPLPRRIRLPITERIPRAVKDPILRRFGHQLGVRATQARLMPRLLLLTPAELTRDPRARRAAVAAQSRGWEVVGLSGTFAVGDEPAELDGVPVTPRWSAAAAPTGCGARRSERSRAARARRFPASCAASTNCFGSRASRCSSCGPAARSGASTSCTRTTSRRCPAGWALARSARARLVYDAHELYTESEPDPPRIYRAVARPARAVAGEAGRARS